MHICQIGVVITNIDLTGYYVGLVADDISGTPIMSNIVQFLAQYTTTPPTTLPPTTDVPTTQTTLRKKPIKKPKKTTKPTTKRPTTKKPRPTTKKPKRPRNRSKIVVNPETPTYNLSQRLHKRLIYFNS